jgi:4-hydroxy-tetrahydrodipicolinate synthase
MTPTFRGSITPLPTPFTADGGRIDVAAIRRMVDWQIDEGSHGLSCTGTTGEPTSLSFEERQLVIRTVVEATAGRVPVLAGTGTNNTTESVAMSRYAHEVGADGILVLAPYHVRPSQQGLFEHFTVIAGATPLPMMLYNIPGRTAVNIEPSTQRRVREAAPNVFGVKEANQDFLQVTRDLAEVGRDWCVFSGIETLCYPMLALGGAGHVSATSNVLPRQLATLYELVRAGDHAAALDLHFAMLPLNEALFLETNPGPLKFLLGAMGLIDPAIRTPLSLPSEDNRRRILAAARQVGIDV